MSKIKWRGGAMTSPLPAVLVTCSDGEKDNVFTVGWTGIVCTDPPKTYISVRPTRHSYEMIKKSGEFCINLTTRELLRAVDLCGVRSGKELDKFEACRLTKEPADSVSCPRLAQSPVTMECRVTDILPLGTHDMFLAEILSVAVDETLVDKAGKLHLERAGLIAYAHGTYFALGEQLGTFGYSVAKKKKRRSAAPAEKMHGAAAPQKSRTKKKPAKKESSRQK